MYNVHDTSGRISQPSQRHNKELYPSLLVLFINISCEFNPRSSKFAVMIRLLYPRLPSQANVLLRHAALSGWVAATNNTQVDYYKDIAVDGNIQFGDFHLIASNSSIERNYAHIEDLGSIVLPGEKVWVRGRISSIREKGNVCFAVLRAKSFYTLQLCHFRDKSDEMSKQLIKFTGNISLESIVDVFGEVKSATVKSCSQKNVEISVQKIFVVSRAPVVLPFSIEDASR